MAETNGGGGGRKQTEVRYKHDLRIAAWIVFGALAVFFVLALIMWATGFAPVSLPQ